MLDSTPRRLRITWRPVRGANAYRIYWRSSLGAYRGTHKHIHKKCKEHSRLHVIITLFIGETESSRLISGDATSYTLDGLQPGLTYIIRFSALLEGGESKATTIQASTGMHSLQTSYSMSASFPFAFSISQSPLLPNLILSDPVPPVSGLSVTDSTENSVLLGWSPVTGATGYILRWREKTGENTVQRHT